MSTLNIQAQNDTFVSSYYPTGNYSDLNYLLTSMSLEDPYQYTLSLLEFDLTSLEDKIIDISNIRLNLFINSIEFNNVNIDILLNSFHYDSSIVTWNTKPQATEILTPLTISKDSFNKYIEIDLTDRVKKYILSSNNALLGLTILMSNPLGGITFGSSKHTNKPFLQICFNDEDTYINSTNTQNINLDFEMAKPCNIINNLMPIIFAKSNIQDLDFYSFDSISGYFTIYNSGKYLLKWSISIKEAVNIDLLSFSILDSCGNTLSSLSASPNPPIRLKNSTLLYVDKDHYRFTIINTSGELVKLSSNASLKPKIELMRL